MVRGGLVYQIKDCSASLRMGWREALPAGTASINDERRRSRPDVPLLLRRRGAGSAAVAGAGSAWGWGRTARATRGQRRRRRRWP